MIESTSLPSSAQRHYSVPDRRPIYLLTSALDLVEVLADLVEVLAAIAGPELDQVGNLALWFLPVVGGPRLIAAVRPAPSSRRNIVWF